MTLQKGYLITSYSQRTVRVRALLDQYGSVFYPGCGGWRPLLRVERFVPLPGLYTWKGWKSEGWYSKNWSDPTWAWVYESSLLLNRAKVRSKT